MGSGMIGLMDRRVWSGKGDRVYLKLLAEEEVTDEYVDWHANQDHTKFYSSSGKVFTREFLINELRAGHESGTLFVYGIYFKENDKLIGNIKIGPIVKQHRTSDLPVFLGDTDYLGKGLAVEAIRLGNQVAFEKYDIRKLYGGMFRANVRSIKAYTRAGWVIEGVRRGQYLVGEEAEDQILFACFSHKYFSDERGGGGVTSDSAEPHYNNREEMVDGTARWAAPGSS